MTFQFVPSEQIYRATFEIYGTYWPVSYCVSTNFDTHHELTVYFFIGKIIPMQIKCTFYTVYRFHMEFIFSDQSIRVKLQIYIVYIIFYKNYSRLLSA